MNKKYKYLILVLIVITSSTHAQYLLKNGSRVDFDLNTGEVRASSQVDSLVCGDPRRDDQVIDYLACGNGTEIGADDLCRVAENEPFTIDYGLTGAISCQGIGGTQQWQGTRFIGDGDGNFNFDVSGISETTTFELQCSDLNQTITDSLTVYIGDNNVDPSCNSYPGPPNTQDDNPGITFEDLANGNSAGNALAQSINFEIERNKYWAIKTVFPSEVVSRKLNFNEPFGNTNRAGYAISLSKCPGDYSRATENSTGRCLVVGGTTSLRWTTDVNENPIFRCIVEPGQTYYINIIHSLVAPYSDSDCDFTDCGVLFQEVLD